jgi:hypothetical protein
MFTSKICIYYYNIEKGSGHSSFSQPMGVVPLVGLNGWLVGT